MKKKLLLLLSFAFISVCLNAKVQVDGIWYVLDEDNKTACVVRKAIFDEAGYEYPDGDSYDGTIVIPEKITMNSVDYVVSKIGFRVFAGAKSLNVTLPSSIAIIESCAFYGCTFASPLLIPNNVTTINSEAFGWCKGLSSITIPNSVVTIEHDAFQSCSELLSVQLPESLTTISERLFAGCSKLTSITIPESITVIENEAFSGCGGLTTITVPKNVVRIGQDAFRNCTSLSDFYVMCNKAPKTTLPPFIADNIKNTTLHVKDYAIETFKGVEPWTWFKEIVCEKETDFNLTYLIDNEQYKQYKHKYDDEIVPESSPKMKGHTFSGWSEIPERMPGKDIDVTGSFSWSKVTKDKVVYQITDTLKNYSAVIGNEDASGSVSIFSEIEFDYVYDVKSVANNAFNGCKGITTIDMPATITSIGERAFAGIDKLTDVTIGALEVPETDRTAFENSYIEDYVTLHVNGAAIKKYKEVAPWKNFKEIVVIPGTEVIEKYKLTYMVDGEEYKVVEINEGEAVTPEDVPTKEGYTFSGWSNIPETMPGEDVTVSGTFTINKYKLVYMVDGQEYKTYDVEYNSAIDAEAAPTKEGYTFSGWSEIPETMPAKDVTVSGTFTVNKYKLTYTVDGESYKEYEVEYGSTITAESEPTKEGYTFSGWSDIPGTMPANDVTVTGSFTINKYTITYYVDGEVYKTYEIEYGSEISQEADPEKEGYDFSGWSWTPSKMPAEDVTVTGSFTKASYDVNGAKYEINDDGMTLTKADGASGDVVLDATVTINGKTYRITVIGEGAFEGNNNITSLTVPDGINTIMPNAFNGCGNLMKLILGKDVRYIGGKAFANIGSASARRRAAAEPLVIECEAEYVPDADSDAFYGVDTKSAILKVNDELVNFYKTTSPWNQFGTILGFNETASVGSIFADEEGAEIYSIDGRRVDKVRRGVNILRTSHGVKKVVGK